MAWETEDIIDAGGLYRTSFGKMMDGTVYDDGMLNVHKGVTALGDQYDIGTPAGLELIQKAVNVGAASAAAGFALTPIVYDPEVIDITRKQTPLQTIFKKRTNYGKTANYYRLTGRGAAEWGTEDAALNEADDTREAVSSDIKFLRVTGRVTGVAHASGAHFYNALQEEVMEKSKSMGMEIENSIINGDTATTATEPNGLIKLLTANNTAVGAAITLEDVNDLLDDCFVDLGAINLMITDAYTLTAIRQQMQDFVRYQDPVKVAWGMDAVAFNSNHGVVPIMASQYMPTGSGSRRVIACDTQTIEQRVLVDVSYEDLAKTADSMKFFMKSYRCLIDRFPEGKGQLTGITE
jgi:hypothetical protein